MFTYTYTYSSDIVELALLNQRVFISQQFFWTQAKIIDEILIEILLRFSLVSNRISSARKQYRGFFTFQKNLKKIAGWRACTDCTDLYCQYIQNVLIKKSVLICTASIFNVY